MPSVYSVAQAANIAAVQSGAWSAGATWGGAVPGNGDIVNIPNGQTVTVTDNRTVGGSGANGSIAITLNNSGSLVVASGGILHVRGNVTASSPGSNVSQLTVQAGAVWEFDSSAAASPASTNYSFAQSGFGYQTLAFLGSATSRAVVRSNAGGGNGYFTRTGGYSITGVTATYTDFLRIGDATNHAFQLFHDTSNLAIGWNATYSTFTNCGSVFAAVPMSSGMGFTHSFNVHTGTVGGEVFQGWLNDTAATGAETRLIVGNVFDAPLGLLTDAFGPTKFTITNNYFGARPGFGGFAGWTLFDWNFIHSTSDSIGLIGTTSDSYIFLDTDQGNPHVTTEVSFAGQPAPNLIGVIYGQAGTALGPPGPSDSGELFWQSDSTFPITEGMYNSIVLPNMAGYSSLELGSMVYSRVSAAAEHNTWFGGWSRGTHVGDGGFAAMQNGESGANTAGIVTSFRSNILWNPQLTGYTSSFFKLADVSHSATPVVDFCVPANCDYNTGFGHSLTSATDPQYKNQGKGYAAKFSSTPGGHDVDMDPMFLDWQRTVELFDSKYLKNSAAPWSSAATYSVGDFAQNSRSDVYWSLPVNYRYINSGACAGTNPEPGAGLNWRACWEWASLFRIRAAIGARQLLDDQIIGVHGEDIVTTVMKWIRAGYAPTNTALMGTGHDGFDIGAVPVVFLPPTTNPAAYTGPAPVTAPGTPVTIRIHGRPY